MPAPFTADGAQTVQQRNEYHKQVAAHLRMMVMLTLARIYIDEPFFYATSFIDSRGRLYSEQSYISYQGDEMSKALMDPFTFVLDLYSRKQ